MELSAEQIKPVLSNEKINITLACPGSGKTVTLISRAERLIDEFKENVLICTFSKKASDELTRRMKQSPLVEIKTLHGLCFDIVKRYWTLLERTIGGEDWSASPIVADKKVESQLIREIYPEEDVARLLDFIEQFRTLPVTPLSAVKLFDQGVWFGADMSRADLQQWAHYERVRVSKGIITFKDMITLAGELMTFPHVSAEVARRWRHLLIDEAQDTSYDQWNVVRPLVMNANSTMIVGDLNQAIYGWRSADGSLISNLAGSPQSTVFSLTHNFRCSDPIVSLSNMFMFGEESKEDHIKAEVLNFKLFNTYDEEVEYVMKSVTAESAIISRTNRYLEKFERYAIENNIAYSGANFYRSTHIKDLNIFFESWKGGDALEKAKESYSENAAYSSRQRNDFKLVFDLIEKKGIEYFKMLVEKAVNISTKGVTIITAHGAKGLEWPSVYLVGCHPGHIPHKLNRDVGEEERIFYVMTTRAKDLLSMTAVEKFSSFITDKLEKYNVPERP